MQTGYYSMYSEMNSRYVDNYFPPSVNMYITFSNISDFLVGLYYVAIICFDYYSQLMIVI